MRVGFWRFVDVLQRFDVIPTFAVNGTVCEEYPRIAREALDRGWEFMGHGHVQGPMHKLDDQRKAIADAIAAIRQFTGKAPRGWESPGLTETGETLDLLRDAGIEYVADWVLDDLPVYLKTAHGPMVSIPYTVEINDVVISAVQQHPSDEIFIRGRAHFDQLYREGTTIPRVMAISVHPYLTGAPHRIDALARLYEHIRQHDDVVFMTGAEIHDCFRSQVKPEF
nr:polysaccharide deacetylase family protein [Natronocella acetinitrilica]